MKKFVSLIMVVVLTSMCMLPAAASQACDCGNSPLILVTGMNSSPLILNHGTDYEKQVFVPTKEDILPAVGNVILPLARVVLDRNWGPFCDNLIPAAQTLLEYIRFNPNGSSAYDIYSQSYENSLAADTQTDMARVAGPIAAKAAQTLGSDHVYTFVYDWRGDPMKISEDLNALIEKVESETHHKKVSLVSVSMGGVITCAYLEKFGSDDIDSLVMASSAFKGVELVGDILTGRFDVDVDAIIRFINQFISTGTFLDNVIPVIFESMYKMGAFNNLEKFLDELVFNCKGRIFDEIVKPILGYMPGVWGLIPEKDYAQAKELLLNEEENSALIDIIDNYHYNVRVNVDNIINDAIDDGMKFSIVSNYNFQGTPVTVSHDMQNDMIIETKYTSAGATCPDHGQVFDANYIQAVNCGHEHISADRMIDASTCLWPEQTWFIKDLMHTDQRYNGNNTEIYVWLATSKTQPYINSNSKYPQFTIFERNTYNISPLLAAG